VWVSEWDTNSSQCILTAATTMPIVHLNRARSYLPLVLATSLISSFPLSITGAAFVSTFGRSRKTSGLLTVTPTSLSPRAFAHRLSSRMDMSSTADVTPGRPTWQQTMLRIRDPAKSIPFYTDLLGFTLIDTFDFPQYKFSIYFLTTLPEGETYNLTPGTQEAHDYLWNMEGVTLELTHNHGTEKGDFEGYHPGNQERDGFGHIAVRYGRILN
jgi:lactoylglutathione lyase